MEKLASKLAGIKTVAIAGHVRPDGDCVGSCMGLYLYLKENEPDIKCDVYLETVKEGVTGLFFYEQTVESIIDAVERFEKLETSFDPKIIRNHAETFSEERFKKEIKEFVELKYNEFNHLVK